MINNPSNTTQIHPVVMQALAFTEAYKRHQNDPIAIREAMCLKAQYPALLADIRPEDLLAGRRPPDRIAYIGTIWWAGFTTVRNGTRVEGKQGGYSFDFGAIEKYGKSEEEKRLVAELAAFWEKEYTSAKVGKHADAQLLAHTGGHAAIMGGGAGFGIAVDLDRLVQKGIPGLIADIEAKEAAARQNGADAAFYQGLRIAMDVIIDVCRYYQQHALQLAGAAGSDAERQRLEKIAATLDAITRHAPRSLREAMQLVWIYTLLASAKHPEAWRLDGALGDLYAHDIDHGVISEEEALDLIQSMWRLYNENGDAAVCRIVVGGMGRRNAANADRFSLAAIEATRRHHRVTPQLTLRFHRGQDTRLLQKAFEVIGAGCTYPMLYNDDVVVPGVAKSLGVPDEVAQYYHPLGCGEYMLACLSPSILQVNWSVPKLLEAVLHNGSSSDGQQFGLQTGTLEQFDTFDKLYAAVLKQVAFAADLGARIYDCSRKELPRQCAYLLASLLTDDCIERGKSLLGGGCRYSGACIMGHGFSNAADALTGIRKVVYEDKRVTLAEVVAALDADFVGHEQTRKLLQAAPKFGNDDAAADGMLVDLWRAMNVAANAAGRRLGFDFLTVSSVNPGGYGMGQMCGATADGRRSGEPFAIGNSPTAGNDKSGLTALFNSISRVDPVNGGATTNFKLSPDWFGGSRTKAQALFEVFFARGGMQATITVVNRGELEAAMQAPEKYPHLLVRMGGWSARFVDLDKRVQTDILQRTHY